MRRNGKWRSEAGVVTVEFVIIFPVLILFLALIGFVSFLIAEQSEVQQVAFELARKGIALVGQNYTGDLCTKLASDYMPALIENSVTLTASKFQTLAACPSQPSSSGVLTISVSYDLLGSGASAFGQMLGISLGDITRSASVIVK